MAATSLSLEEGMPANYAEPRWYAAHTYARHEKRVAEQLKQKAVEQFLPLYESLRRWKDRKVRLELPLFPGYIFVRTSVLDKLNVIRVPGVVRLVSFNGRPTPIPETEIAALRRGLNAGVTVKPHPYLKMGRPVRVKSGPLTGLTGRLVRTKQNCRIVISIEAIMRSIVAEISLDEVEVTMN